MPQAFYNKEAGINKITTETGAGQWGSSLAFAGALFGIEVQVFMVRISYNQKPYRRALMETYGAKCIASPSNETQSGRAILAKHPDSNGSLGIAISEAVEIAAQRDDTKYALGSVLNHVLMHQTVVGIEAMKQLEMAGDYPDIVIGCTGGGSNFGGAQRAGVEPAEVERREIGDVEDDVRLALGPPRFGAEPVPALVPRAEGVAHLGDERVLAVPRADSERGVHVDEPQPQRVGEPDAQPPRVANGVQERPCGIVCAVVTVAVRSIEKRKRQISRVARCEVPSASATRTVPFGMPRSQFSLTR